MLSGILTLSAQVTSVTGALNRIQALEQTIVDRKCYDIH
jgi:hypothetical protein